MAGDQAKAAYKAMILHQLDQIEEREMERAAASRSNEALAVDLLTRYQHARLAFPGMTWEEFGELDRQRRNGGKRGRRAVGPHARAQTPIARAARDVDRINAFWRSSVPGGPTAEPPLSAIEIAAERHGVDEDELGERVRRPKSRNPHRMLAEG